MQAQDLLGMVRGPEFSVHLEISSRILPELLSKTKHAHEEFYKTNKASGSLTTASQGACYLSNYGEEVEGSFLDLALWLAH